MKTLIPLIVCAAVSAFAVSTANAAAFAPSELSDLVLWVDGDTGVTETAGDVSFWADQSSAGNNLAQGTGAYQPSVVSGVLNGHDAISFSTNGAGTADNEYLSNAALQLDTTTTAFYVMNPDSTAGNSQRFAGHYSNGQFRFNNDKASMFTSGGNADLTSPEAVAGSFQILTYRINGAVEGSINSPDLVQTKATSSFDNSDFLIGGVPNTFVTGVEYGSFDGDFAEVIVYDRALSDAEIGKVGAYLADKYNLGASYVGKSQERVVYDFEAPAVNGSAFPGTTLHGQDNWATSVGGNTQTVRTGDSGIDGTAMGFGSGGDSQIARQNDANFSFNIPDGSKFLFEFDARIGTTRSMEVGLVDAGNIARIVVGGPGSFIDEWRLRAPGGDTTSADLFPTVGSDYFHLLLKVDLAANGGDGAAWLFVADLNGDNGPELLTAVAGMQNINLGLGAIDGSDLTGLYFRANGGGGVDNISITFAVPAPAAMPAGLAMIALIAARRRR